MQVHFDESQYESGRADRKLKATAVPTLRGHASPQLPIKQSRMLKRASTSDTSSTATKLKASGFTIASPTPANREVPESGSPWYDVPVLFPAGHDQS